MAGNVLGNTASGAATGAAAGSFIPGIGTGVGALIGGGVGLLSGLFGGGTDELDPAKFRMEDPTGRLGRSLAGIKGAQNFQVNPDFAPSNQVAGQQADLASTLIARANGTGGPSIAETQLRAGTDRGIAQTAGLAAMNRGVNPAMALRTQQQGAAGMLAQAGQDAATLRAQEQAQAQQVLMQALQAQRAQELNQAQLGADTQLQSRALGNDMLKFYENSIYQTDAANTGNAFDVAKLNAGFDEAAANRSNSLAGSLIGAGGYLAGSMLGGGAKT